MGIASGVKFAGGRSRRDMEDTKEQPKIRKAEKEDYREIAGFM